MEETEILKSLDKQENHYSYTDETVYVTQLLFILLSYLSMLGCSYVYRSLQGDKLVIKWIITIVNTFLFM